MPWPPTGATHFHSQLGNPDKGHAIEGLVVPNVCCSMAKINDLWWGLWTSAICMGLVPCCGQDGYRAQVPQHRFI